MAILKQRIQVAHIVKTLLVICYDHHVVRNHDLILALVVFNHIAVFLQRLRHFGPKIILQLIPIVWTTNQLTIQLLIQVSR